MKRYRVEFSPEATRHADRIQHWWAANRPKAPGLFQRELAVAIRHLRQNPQSAQSYDAEIPGSRRLLLPRTRHHVYFVIDEVAGCVRVYAVWHASRGSGPS